MRIGDIAPDFTLPCTGDELSHGNTLTFSTLLGHGPIVVFFYPKNGTPGCVKQMCGFRDEYAVFRQHGAQVIGISSDSAQSHHHAAAQKAIPFPLLSDQGGQVRHAWGIPQFLGLLPHRVTLVLNHHGQLYHRTVDMFNSGRHVMEALAAVRQLTSQPTQDH